ncbi:hypothetical protein [Sulfurimonas sp. HSL-1716]|uniref:hypothetical protein n=1 Tax=Hydrocurvibacter sulfurireducens TaxID=3131937 RepID=UPI0031F73172
MAYFDDVKKGDKLYGLVFGKGKVIEVFENSHYKMMVSFKNGYEVPYTEDGIPGWGNFKKQTIFYKKDIDLTDVDFTPTKKVLSTKKIIKLREKKKLEVRLPSGIWTDCTKCVKGYIEDMLEKEKYHLFRKKK